MRVVSPYAVLFALAGCSVINSFDDVKPQATTSDTGGSGNETGGKGGTSGGSSNSGGSSGADASAGGTVASGGAAGSTTAGGAGGKGGAAGSTAGSAGVGGNEGGADVFVPGGPKGALVSYNAADKKLYVLDPDTGKALSSEPMNRVRGIVNDGGSDPNDHWYILEDVTAGQPLSDPVALHVRDLDVTTGAWKEIGSLPAVPPPFYSRAVAFGASPNAGIAYLTDPATPPSGGSVAHLVVIDVTNPTKPAIVPLSTGPTGINPVAAGDKIGLVAEQNSVNVVIKQSAPCPTGEGGIAACAVYAQHFLANGKNVTKVGQTQIGETAASGNVDFVDDPLHKNHVVAFPPLDDLGGAGVCTQTSRRTGTVKVIAPNTLAIVSEVTIQLEMTRFSGGAAFDTCNSIAFLTTAINDVAIWAVPVNGGAATKRCDSSSGGRLLYEPYTHTLFRATGTDMQAFTVDGKASPPTLKDKVLGQLPGGFQFGSSAVRNPNTPPNCN